MFLRFTKVAWDDLGFPIQPATFELDLLALLEFAYERRDFCGHLKDVSAQDPPAEELAAEWTPTIQVLEELVARAKQGDVLDTPSGNHGVEHCVAPLIAERKYRVVNCPACSNTYEARAVVEEDFGYDEGIFGGHRYLCPEGHVLFAFVRFDKRNFDNFG